MSIQIKDKIISIIRADFDQTPKNWGGDGWYDNAEEVADSIVALFASPQTDLVSRAEVLRVIRALGDQDATPAASPATEGTVAQRKEHAEPDEGRQDAGSTPAGSAPAASPSPAPAAVEELVARLAYRLKKATDEQVILDEADADGLLTALSTLAADKARIEAERDAALDLAQRSTRRLAESSEPGFIGAFARRDAALAERDQFRDRAEAAEARASALEGEVERLKSDREYVIGFNAGWEEAIKQNLRFPTMLRKMWAGHEVQQWLDDKLADANRAALSPAKETTDE